MMVEFALAAAIASNSGTSSRGMSDEAQKVSKMVQEARGHLQNSFSPGVGRVVELSELGHIAQECRNDNWDGYGAIPVSRSTLIYAEEFIKAIPLGLPSPSITADPDGHVAFEWYHSPSRLLSVSIGPAGEINFAAILGTTKRWGSDNFSGEFPQDIVNLIRQVKISLRQAAA